MSSRGAKEKEISRLIAENMTLRSEIERLKYLAKFWERQAEVFVENIKFLRDEGITEAILTNPTFQRARTALKAQTVGLAKGRSQGALAGKTKAQKRLSIFKQAVVDYRDNCRRRGVIPTPDDTYEKAVRGKPYAYAMRRSLQIIRRILD